VLFLFVILICSWTNYNLIEAKKVSPSSEITDFADDTEEGEIEYEQEEREEEEEEEEEESYDIEYVEV
jgi:hypothetical protein